MNRSNLWFLGFLLRTRGRSGLKFGMLMYPDHLQNWLDFGHGLLIFIIFVMSALWFHANLISLWELRSVTAIRCIDLLDHLYLVISGREKTTTGSALDGAVFDIAQILAYLVHNMSRSQLYLGFGHFGWLTFFSVNNILAGLWLNCISSVEITLFLLADILLQHRALFQC